MNTLTSATFDEEIKSSEVPVLVDFWAEWCKPCHVVAPILDEIAAEKAGSLLVAKLDVDKNPDITTRYEVQSMPTMILFKDGAPSGLRIIGAKSKAQLLSEISPYLG